MKKINNLKIAVIGCGYWGTVVILTLFKLGIKNIVVFDNYKDNLKTILKRFPKVIIAKNLENIVNDKTVSSAIICTPASTHYNIAKKFVEKEKNLFIEKPVCLSSYEVQKLKKLSNKKNIFIMSGYVYNYNVYINYIKKILKKKQLGKIRYISIERSNLGPIRNDVSSIWDLGSHDISSSLYILESLPIKIEANGYDFLKKNIYDVSFLRLIFPNKILVNIQSNWISPEKVRKLVIVGSKKMLLFDEMNKKNPIKIYNKYAKYPKLSTFKNDFFSTKANIYKGKTITPKIKYRPSMELELEHFCKCLIEKKKPKTDINYAFQISKLIENIKYLN